MVEKTGTNAFKISGRIDANNAKQFETELLADVNAREDVVIDASELEYISSAGLRVFLKLKKMTKGSVDVAEVSNEVYDIFDVTGFTNLLNVKKRLRNVDVEGCEVIGEGANGKVYRIDPETIIKVFASGVPLKTVQEERDFAQAAFVAGVPTAISYDVVKCGDCYGAVYEMLDAKTMAQTIKENPDKAEAYGTMMGKLLKELHHTQADTKVLNNISKLYAERVEFMRRYCTDADIDKMKRIYEALPERSTILHGDYHAKNIMLVNDEPTFIDMGDVGFGHPFFDIGGSFLGMVHIGLTNPAIVERYIGINYDLALKAWDAMLHEYFGAENVEEAKKLAEIYGRAKYALTPAFYTKMTEDMAKHLVEGVRATGIFTDKFDVSGLSQSKLIKEI